MQSRILALYFNISSWKLINCHGLMLEVIIVLNDNYLVCKYGDMTHKTGLGVYKYNYY